MTDPYEFDGLEAVLGLADVTAREWDHASAVMVGLPEWMLAELRR